MGDPLHGALKGRLCEETIKARPNRARTNRGVKNSELCPEGSFSAQLLPVASFGDKIFGFFSSSGTAEEARLSLALPEM